MRKLLYVLCFAHFLSCTQHASEDDEKDLINRLAADYVKLGLKIGQYDTDFVDAYYGADSLKPTLPKLGIFPKDSLLKEVGALAASFQKVKRSTQNDTIRARATWIGRQLTAFQRRINIFAGNYSSFDSESRDLFDAVAPVYSEGHFKALIARLDSILPGTGALPQRYQQLAGNFILPKSKIDTVFKTAIIEARKRTLKHYALPKEESFVLEYVTDKPWSGYNWYQGRYKSIIQINISQPIFIERAIDLACHEGYPGHHVFNTLLEKNLYRDKGWIEVSLYPLFSPQSLIAEGSANYGIEMAFPGGEQKVFCKNVLIPLAGLDTTHCDKYFQAISLLSKLNYARNEVARRLLGGKMSEPEAMRWLQEYCLFSPQSAANSVRFISKYRSYVINYNYGQALVKDYIETQTGSNETPEERWRHFEKLLMNEYSASDLIGKGE